MKKGVYPVERLGVVRSLQSTESISYLIYQNGINGGQFGFQSANAVVFFVVIVTISVLQLRFTGKKEEQL